METKQSYVLYTLYEDVPTDMFYLRVPTDKWLFTETKDTATVTPVFENMDFYIVLN